MYLLWLHDSKMCNNAEGEHRKDVAEYNKVEDGYTPRRNIHLEFYTEFKNGLKMGKKELRD